MTFCRQHRSFVVHWWDLRILCFAEENFRLYLSTRRHKHSNLPAGYPCFARTALFLQAIISKNGTIENLKVVSGHPMLTQSAIDAVSRWRYQPTVLNGEPVEVETSIEVTFTLAGG